MRISQILVISLALLFTVGFAFAQDAPEDLCADVTCSDSTTTCADGVTVSCSNSCSSGVCESCSPDCTGHDAPPTDPCEGVVCSDSTTTCADGVTVSCSNSCSAGTCESCNPDCSGHDLTTDPVTDSPSCPDIGSPPSCGENEYYESDYDSNNCVIGYRCVAQETTTSCPEKFPPECSENEFVGEFYDDNGCKFYNCQSNDYKECPTIDYPGALDCQEGFYIAPLYDNNGCIYDYVCEGSSTTQPDNCPFVQEPFCDNGYPVAQFDNSGCITFYNCETYQPPSQGSYCGDGICDPGEDFCQDDCKIGGPGETCPISLTCFDQSIVQCYQTEFGCDCDQCPIPDSNIPEGCRQETDANGFVRVKCESSQVVCEDTPQDKKIECVDNGGIPRFTSDYNGCNIFNCDFGNAPVSPIGISNRECLDDAAAGEVKRKCESLNLRTVFNFDGQCHVPRCVQYEDQQHDCRYQTESGTRNIHEQCMAEGRDIIRDFVDGCPIQRCGERDQCPRDPPHEAFEKCGQDGGELIVQRDHNGCMKFSDCVRRGNERDAYIERPDHIPETTELLAIAFRLESLRIELDKLAEKTDDIAKYYESEGSSDSERFERVSDMFSAAVDKVDDIRDTLKERLDDITFNDLIEIKGDIRYIKDVMIKDILYLMLSESSEIREIEAGDETDCGTSGSCFDRAIRVCKPIIFYPEGRRGPEVKLRGLEDGVCIMHVELPEGEGPPPGFVPGLSPPYEMTCKLEKYALGVRDPETDVIPFCTGNMVELMKQFGTDGQGGPAGPGGCRGPDECENFCRNPDNFEECRRFANEHGFEDEFDDRRDSQFERDRFDDFEDFDDFRNDQFRDDFQRDDNFIRDDFRQDDFRDFPEDDFRQDDFSGNNFPQDNFRGEVSRPPIDQFERDFQRGNPNPPQDFNQPSPSFNQPTQAACTGCFDDGFCGPNECGGCSDCLR